MSPPLITRPAGVARAAAGRLRGAVWPITQTAVAAGVAWYFTHDLLGHRQPFFAPIAAVVCLSATNVLRGQRAVQMIIGVVLGIALGAGVQAVLGTGVIAIAVAVFVAMCVALLIGRGFIAQGLMFVNQTAVSAVLVLVFARSGMVSERLFDTVVGGGLAIVFGMLLFPVNPMTLLHQARADMLAALRETLAHIAGIVGGHGPAAPDWPLSVVGRLHEQLGALAQARATARQAVRVAPRRWAQRGAVDGADQQAAHLGLLASSVLHLARVVAPAHADWLPQSMHAAVDELAAATALADSGPAAAADHAAAARRHASELAHAARNHEAVILAAVVATCVDDLEAVITLPRRETPRPDASAPASAKPR